MCRDVQVHKLQRSECDTFDAVTIGSQADVRSGTNKTTRRLASEGRKIQGLEDPPPFSTSCLLDETEVVHLRTLAWRPPRRAKRHSYAEGTKVILKRPDRSVQVGKILKNCTTPSTQDRIPVHRPSVKITNLEIAPTAQSSSFPKITQDVPSTHVQQTLHTVETTRAEEVQSEDTQSEDNDGGHLLAFV